MKTDHASLKWLFNLHNPTGRLPRWALTLQGYNFTIEHREGSANVIPDRLSRMYEEENVLETAGVDFEEETKDRWYLSMIDKVKSAPTEYSYWKYVSGRLYTYRPNPKIDDIINHETACKLVVPSERCDRELSECHDEPSAGHLGRYKTRE